MKIFSMKNLMKFQIIKLLKVMNLIILIKLIGKFKNLNSKIIINKTIRFWILYIKILIKVFYRKSMIFQTQIKLILLGKIFLVNNIIIIINLKFPSESLNKIKK